MKNINAMPNDQITFDEVDLNYLLTAVTEQLATTKWNPLDQDQWLQLKHLKGLQDKILRAIDGIPQGPSLEPLHRPG